MVTVTVRNPTPGSMSTLHFGSGPPGDLVPSHPLLPGAGDRAAQGQPQQQAREETARSKFGEQGYGSVAV